MSVSELEVPNDLSPSEILGFMLDAEDVVYKVFQGEHSRYMVAKQAFEENIGKMHEAFYQAFTIAQQHGNQISDDIVQRANRRKMDLLKTTRPSSSSSASSASSACFSSSHEKSPPSSPPISTPPISSAMRSSRKEGGS